MEDWVSSISMAVGLVLPIKIAAFASILACQRPLALSHFKRKGKSLTFDLHVQEALYDSHTCVCDSIEVSVGMTEQSCGSSPLEF